MLGDHQLGERDRRAEVLQSWAELVCYKTRMYLKAVTSFEKYGIVFVFKFSSPTMEKTFSVDFCRLNMASNF